MVMTTQCLAASHPLRDHGLSMTFKNSPVPCYFDANNAVARPPRPGCVWRCHTHKAPQCHRARNNNNSVYCSTVFKLYKSKHSTGVILLNTRWTSLSSSAGRTRAACLTLHWLYRGPYQMSCLRTSRTECPPGQAGHVPLKWNAPSCVSASHRHPSNLLEMCFLESEGLWLNEESITLWYGSPSGGEARNCFITFSNT